MYDISTHARQTPDRPAIIMGWSGEQLSFAELDQRSRRLARHLRDLGLRPGDHVAVLLENHLRFMEVYWAAMRCGLYLTPVNRHLTAREAGHIVDDCDAQVLITSRALGETATEVVPLTPRVRHRLMIGGTAAFHESYEDALAGARSSETAPGAEPSGAEPLGLPMFYSSGSTGRPKGIWRPLPKRSLAQGAAALEPLYRRLVGLGPDAVYLEPAPLYHAASLNLTAACTALGATVILMERFRPERALELIEAHRVTHAQFVATMFHRMLELPAQVRDGHDVSSLTMVIHGAGPCPVPVKRAMIDWLGPIVGEGYGSTEGNGSTFITAAEWLERPGSVGRPMAGCDVRVCGVDGSDVPAGTTGRVYFSAPGAEPFAYYGDPEKTAGVQHPRDPGWTATGDLGYRDDDGYLYLVGREAFMIISGGINVYPQEVEDVVAEHPDVRDVAIFGVPDEDLGEVVMAVVQPSPRVTSLDDLRAELAEHCAQRLARFKVPRRFEFLEEIPRAPTGKLQKAALRQRYVDAETEPTSSPAGDESVRADERNQEVR